MGKAAGAGDDPHQDVGAVVGGEHGSRRRSTSGLHDPNVTFEEYYYYALQSRAHPSEAPDAPSSASTSRMSKFMPFGKRDAPSANNNAAMDEKNSEGSFTAHSWHNVSDEERLQASRALRTATWGAVFYLITTDILGPYTTAYASNRSPARGSLANRSKSWAFSQMGYAPASILYFIFGVFAA
ncbi:MAG: hypothetical protein L6R38_008797 [Xanthoria sp. 2 TBL-2021]|nr:MAG: hypothetical protein L6R38_008797 [Xanthoria sp. 2 TBL-2021]